VRLVNVSVSGQWPVSQRQIYAGVSQYVRATALTFVPGDVLLATIRALCSAVQLDHNRLVSFGERALRCGVPMALLLEVVSSGAFAGGSRFLGAMAHSRKRWHQRPTAHRESRHACAARLVNLILRAHLVKAGA
jgi:hypothetical protein